MNLLLAKLRAAGALAWVRFVQALNWIAVLATSAVVTIDAMYHDEVEAALAHTNPILKFALLAAWALLVHYGLRRAAKASS